MNTQIYTERAVIMEDTSFVNEKESKILETTEEILFSTSEETTAVGEVIVDNIPT
jgi:hypothetical protein